MSSRKSKILHFVVFLLSKSYKITAKKVKKSYLMKLKSDVKLKRKLTYGFKYDMRNYVNFHPTTQKSEKLYFDGLFFSKSYNISAKNWRVTLTSDAKFKEKLTRGWKNYIRNLVSFHATNRKSENLHFDGLLLFKVYSVWAKKIQRNYASWHYRVMQYLKKKWPMVWKMT